MMLQFQQGRRRALDEVALVDDSSRVSLYCRRSINTSNPPACFSMTG